MQTPYASDIDDGSSLLVSETDCLVNGDTKKEKVFFGCIPGTLLNVLLLGIMFMVLFTAFAPTQVLYFKGT